MSPSSNPTTFFILKRIFPFLTFLQNKAARLACRAHNPEVLGSNPIPVIPN